MKKNKKAAAEGVEPILVWVVVIIVVLLVAFFLFRTRIDLWIKNLPDYQRNDSEDIEIVPDEDLAFFDCKYPVGIVDLNKKGAYRKIFLIRAYDIKERDYKEILNKNVLDESLYFFMSKDGKKIEFMDSVIFDLNFLIGRLRLGGDLEKVAEVKEIYDSRGVKTNWNKIVLEKSAKDFALTKNSILGETEIPQNLLNLKDELALLYEARYHPSTGLICGNPSVVESLRDSKKCIVEKCEIYGGECKERGEEITLWKFYPEKDPPYPGGLYENVITKEGIAKNIIAEKGDIFFFEDQPYKVIKNAKINSEVLTNEMIKNLENQDIINNLPNKISEINIGKLNCDSKKECYINPAKQKSGNQNLGYLIFKQKGRDELLSSKETFFKGAKYNFEFSLDPKRNFCYSIRTNKGIVDKGYSFEGLIGDLDIEKEIIFSDENSLIISAWNPSSGDSVYKAILIEVKDLDLKGFLEEEILVNDKKIKVYEQMIEIVEGRSKDWIEESAKNLLPALNEKYGSSGWAIRYSKEGPSYPWNYINTRAWHIANPSNLVKEEEHIFPYSNGKLKVQTRILRGP